MQTYTTIEQIGEVLKRQLPSKLVSKQNMRSASAALTIKHEKAYCKECRSLEKCQYTGAQGFEPVWEEWTPRHDFVKKCRHRKRWEAQKIAERLFGESGMPQEFARAYLRDLPIKEMTTPQMQAAERLMKLKRGESLRLIGGENTGKTVLMCAYGNEMIAEGWSVLYRTTTELLNELRYTSTTYEEKLKRAQETEVLLLDNIGEERQSEYNEEQLELVTARRRREGRTTIAGTRGYAYERRLQKELNSIEQIRL